MSLLLAAVVNQADIDFYCPDHAEKCVIMFIPKEARTVFDAVCVKINAETGKILAQWPATVTRGEIDPDSGKSMYMTGCRAE